MYKSVNNDNARPRDRDRLPVIINNVTDVKGEEHDEKLSAAILNSPLALSLYLSHSWLSFSVRRLFAVHRFDNWYPLTGLNIYHLSYIFISIEGRELYY